MTPIDPKDLKPGQRVRVTFEATVIGGGVSDVLRMCLIEDEDIVTNFLPEEFPALTCELLPEPIKVGDRVSHVWGSEGTVLAIYKDTAWAATDTECAHPLVLALGNLTKIQDPAA